MSDLPRTYTLYLYLYLYLLALSRIHQLLLYFQNFLCQQLS
jgi:hypothetical protein